jgi:hypothetical protein
MELTAAPRARKAGGEVKEHESNGETEGDRVIEVTIVLRTESEASGGIGASLRCKLFGLWLRWR